MKSIENIPRPFFEIFYFCFTLFLTFLYSYPLIFNLGSMFYGFSWDSLGAIWSFWWLKFSYVQGLPLYVHTYLSYPFGQIFSSMLFPYLINGVGFLLTFFTHEIIAYNILKLISFPILALTTYLLIYYLTRNKVVSAVIGLVYAFSPFHVIHNIAHFANVYWLPLTILFLLKLLWERGYKNGILFGFFWGLTFVDNVYYAYFFGLLIPIFIVVYLSNQEHRVSLFNISFLKFVFIGFLVFFLVVFPMLYPMVKEVLFVQSKQVVGISGLARNFSDLFIGSAKPLDYFLPSKHNPFLGWLVPDLGMGPLKGHKYTEHTLYLGWSLILLAGYAVYCSARKIGELGTNKENRHAVYLFLSVAIAAAILSAPPFIPIGDYQVNFQTREVIAEHKIYLPQYFLYKLFPMFRVYARMGAIVLLAVCVLSAFGLKEILNRINSKTGKFLFLSSFLTVVLVEYAEFPSFRLTKVKEPEVYKWLASQSGQFPIVEYPLGASDDPYTTYEYYFYQRIHKKYLVNGAPKGTPADEFRKEIIDISRGVTVAKLSGIGVIYVLVHRDKYIKGNEYVPLDWLTKPPRDKIFPVEYNDGKIPSLPMNKLKLVKDFGDTAVYEPIQNSQ